jgi:ribonucleotide reductase beta subunit family protein with ferritin-like domain
MLAARTGKGTVGRLLQDPQLYENLTDTARRAEEAIAKLNLLLDKIRAEGLGVQLGSP